MAQDESFVHPWLERGVCAIKSQGDGARGCGRVLSPSEGGQDQPAHLAGSRPVDPGGGRFGVLIPSLQEGF